jgi:hypothetical protein
MEPKPKDLSEGEPAWDQIYIEGKNYAGEQPPLRIYNYVSPGYFHTAGTRIVAGRDFLWTEIYGLRPVGLMSESLARELWEVAQRGHRQTVPRISEYALA